MGLLNQRTINKVKHLALKNKDKIADNVSKATDALDKRTGGKHHDKLQKLDDAASKFAGRPPDAEESDAPTADEAAADEPTAGEPTT